MASKFTKRDLESITDYIEFENFCDDLMSSHGHKDIEPLGGYKDRGRDAVHISKSTGEVTIFAYSVQEDWKEKLSEDLEKIYGHGHECDCVVFATTSNPTATQKDNIKSEVKAKYNWRLDIYDIKRIATLVDNHYQHLRQLHPGIFMFSSLLPEKQESSKDELNLNLYARYLLKTYAEWQVNYTPLLADHHEIETYVTLMGGKRANEHAILVSKIPEIAPVSVVLGESGAGKTTALWRILVETSKALIDDNLNKIPIRISLRAWDADRPCRLLVQDQFALVGASEDAVERELKKGNCLILIDGLNELPPARSARAYKDVQRFLFEHSQNKFLISCRTADYDSRMLDIEQLQPKLPEPKVFEIRRLEREEIVSYIRRYFKDNQRDADRLLSKLRINSDTLWRDTKSILHLARIPLYLQLFITQFRRTGELPTNRAKLLKTLVDKTIERESVRHANMVDRFAKEMLLGAFAYSAIRDGYSLRLPENKAHGIVRTQIQRLKDESLIEPHLTFGAVWQEILSNNFLKVVDGLWVEWLHQLIFDYFLAWRRAQRLGLTIAVI